MESRYVGYDLIDVLVGYGYRTIGDNFGAFCLLLILSLGKPACPRVFLLRRELASILALTATCVRDTPSQLPFGSIY